MPLEVRKEKCTGCETEVKEMPKTLTENRRTGFSSYGAPLGEYTRYLPWSKARSNEYRKEIAVSGAILMLTSGDGLQVVRRLILEEEFELIKPIYPGTNPVGYMGEPTLLKEKCQRLIVSG